MPEKKKNRLNCPHPMNSREFGICLDCDYEINPPMPVRRIPCPSEVESIVELSLLEENGIFCLTAVYTNRQVLLHSQTMPSIYQYLASIALPEYPIYYYFNIPSKKDWENNLRRKFPNIKFEIIYS